MITKMAFILCHSIASKETVVTKLLVRQNRAVGPARYFEKIFFNEKSVRFLHPAGILRFTKTSEDGRE